MVGRLKSSGIPKVSKIEKIYFTPVVSDAVATPKEDNFSLSLTKDSYYN